MHSAHHCASVQDKRQECNLAVSMLRVTTLHTARGMSTWADPFALINAICVCCRTDIGRMSRYIESLMFSWRRSMRNLRAIGVGTVSLLATGVSLAQNGNMMNGGTWGAGWMGGYGGGSMILLLVVVVVLVAWVVKRSDK